ncbi:glycosyltransferase family 9 protein [Olivibacter sp. SDN3]|nr:glycosyltransferase family 9 protein [Olivibacter sp. SDN3]
MGDVAMTAPVLEQFVKQYPDTQLIVVSRALFKPFFTDISNLIFHPIDPKGKHKGLMGLYRLFLELKAYKVDAVADLHNNLRSRVLCFFFRFLSVPIKRIDKGRKEKKALTRKENKVLRPLKSTIDRYLDVFRALHYQSFVLEQSLKRKKKSIPQQLSTYFNDTTHFKVGIAPFAQHTYKMYPLHLMEQVINTLNGLPVNIFIFGGGEEEKLIAQGWEKKYDHVINVIGNINLSEELNLIANIDLMVSMDSSGMHLASLMGIPVISIWGPTHPYAGFLGFGQLQEDCIQIDHPSRPSSVYGNKPCLCGETPCIELIKPEQIIRKIQQKLNNG